MNGFGGLTLEQIGDLTDHQIANIYARVLDDEKKKHELPPGDSGMGPWELYQHVWMNLRGMSEAECRAKWQHDYPDQPLPDDVEVWQPSPEQWGVLMED